MSGIHRRKGCDEPATEITLHGLQEENHSAMVANEGIVSNSSHSLPFHSSDRCAFFDLDVRLGGHMDFFHNKKRIIHIAACPQELYRS